MLPSPACGRGAGGEGLQAADFAVPLGVGHSKIHPGERHMPLPNPLITSTAERLGGTPVFAGTRVPVQALLDYFKGGDSLDDFLMDFPSVTREHAIAVLEAAK